MDLEALILVLHSFIAFAGLRRASLFFPSSVFLLYTYISCVIFYIVRVNELSKYDFVIDGVYFSAMPFTGLEPFALRVQLIFMAISMLCLLASAGISKTDRTIRFSMSTDFIRGREMQISVALFSLIIISFLHFFSLDASLLWLNDQYLTIKDPKMIGIDNDFMSIYHNLFRYIGLVSLCYLILCVHDKKNKFHSILSAILSLYSFVILLAGSSRWVLIYLVVAIIMIFIIGKHKSKYALVLILLMLFILLGNTVFQGRTNELQGVSQIAKNFMSFDLEGIFWVLFSYSVNIFESAFNLANSLKGEYVFNQKYKILSFSPFPSVVDNFSSIRDVHKHKFTSHVPMGAYGEVISFGVIYICMFFGGLLVYLRKMNKVVASSQGFICIACLALSMVIAVYLPNYSIRTTWRVMILLTLLGCLLDLKIEYKSILIKLPHK